jgi:hypothetical protein
VILAIQKLVAFILLSYPQQTGPLIFKRRLRGFG